MVALLVVLGWAIPRWLGGAGVPAETLAYTECPWFGDARVRVARGLGPADREPVLRHEQVHAAQCRELGPVRYRWRNLRASGRLSLEAPAYCEGARARLVQGMTRSQVRERLVDDVAAAFHEEDLDPAVVAAALTRGCAEVMTR